MNVFLLSAIVLGKLRLGKVALWFLKFSGSKEEVEQDVYSKSTKRKERYVSRNKTSYLELEGLQ